MLGRPARSRGHRLDPGRIAVPATCTLQDLAGLRLEDREQVAHVNEVVEFPLLSRRERALPSLGGECIDPLLVSGTEGESRNFRAVAGDRLAASSSDSCSSNAVPTGSAFVPALVAMTSGFERELREDQPPQYTRRPGRNAGRGGMPRGSPEPTKRRTPLPALSRGKASARFSELVQDRNWRG